MRFPHQMFAQHDACADCAFVRAQTSTLLGPAFALGVIPDAMSAPRPSVFDTCLQGLSRKSPQEMQRTQETLRTVMHTIYSMLHTLSMNFLKSQVGMLLPCSSTGLECASHRRSSGAIDFHRCAMGLAITGNRCSTRDSAEGYMVQWGTL